MQNRINPILHVHVQTLLTGTNMLSRAVVKRNLSRYPYLFTFPNLSLRLVRARHFFVRKYILVATKKISPVGVYMHGGGSFDRHPQFWKINQTNKPIFIAFDEDWWALFPCQIWRCQLQNFSSYREKMEKNDAKCRKSRNHGVMNSKLLLREKYLRYDPYIWQDYGWHDKVYVPLEKFTIAMHFLLKFGILRSAGQKSPPPMHRHPGRTPCRIGLRGNRGMSLN